MRLRRLSLAKLSLAAGCVCAASTARAQITNGSFETGNFTGWTRSGFLKSTGGPTTGGPNYATFVAAQAGATTKADTNAVVASQSTAFDGLGTAGPAIGPTNGAFLAFITNETSAGNNTLTGSSISQTFVAPTGAKSLSFDARLLNNDATSAFVIFDDFGGVALLSGSTVLAQYNLDLNPASAADGHVTANANAGGFTNSTTFLSHSFDLTGLDGQSLTLVAYSTTYGGDNSVETRLLLDNVRVAAVPEPGSVALLVGMTITGAGFLSRRRRQARNAA